MEPPWRVDVGSLGQLSRLCVGADNRYSHLESFKSTPQSTTNYLKGCKWSPDGMCLLTNAHDNTLRVYNTPEKLWESTSHTVASDSSKIMAESAGPGEAIEMKPVLEMCEGELIYDYEWYAHLDSRDVNTCMLFSSSRDHPVHCWDAYTGALKMTFRNYDQYDAITACNSLASSPNGRDLACGLIDAVHIFRIERPGREYQKRKTTPRGGGGCKGIVSTLTYAPEDSGSIYACGCFSGQLALFDLSTQAPIWNTRFSRGVTDIVFGDDGFSMAVGLRVDGSIFHYDRRQLGEPTHVFERELGSNQRLHMDMTPCGRYLISGSQRGDVSFYDLWAGRSEGVSPPVACEQVAHTAVNAVAVHPSCAALAVATGRRVIASPNTADEDVDADEGPSVDKREGDEHVAVYRLPCRPHVPE